MLLKILKRVKNYFFPDKQLKRVKPWFIANGDKTLRLNYDLNEQAVVVDLGGYEGQWASDICAMYKCKLFVFEPYKPFAEKIMARFARNDDIKVFAYGLGNADQILPLGISNDASSLFKVGKETPTAEIEIKDIAAFLKQENIQKIDLLKINIEGGEYDLLDHLIASGNIQMVSNIQVQFHDFVPDAALRMKAIQDRLSLTHQPTYQFEYVWENWQKK
jgi:FkbM family methyltransferase